MSFKETKIGCEGGKVFRPDSHFRFMNV